MTDPEIRRGQRVRVSWGCDDPVIAGRVVVVNTGPNADDMVDVKVFYRTLVNVGLLTVVEPPPPLPEPELDEDDHE